MREIKFRGMDVNGNWFYGNLAVLKEDINFVKRGTYISNTIGQPFAYQVRPETVGQYTGLNDKNGTKIYEGDTIKVSVDNNQDFHGSYALHEVMNINGQWATSYLFSETGDKLPKGYLRGFLLDHYEYTGKLFLWSEDYKPETEIEVIGNIHE